MSRRARVVVVEDHLLVRETLRSYLAREPDMEVVAEASEASGACDAVAATRPDVVVLDITLPGISGIWVARELLRRDPSLRIVFLSMHQTDFTINQALATGAFGYVCKSQPGADLVTAIRTALLGRRYIPPVAKRLPENLRREQPTGRLEVLSAREQEIFGLLLQGLPRPSTRSLLSAFPSSEPPS